MARSASTRLGPSCPRMIEVSHHPRRLGLSPSVTERTQCSMTGRADSRARGRYRDGTNPIRERKGPDGTNPIRPGGCRDGTNPIRPVMARDGTNPIRQMMARDGTNPMLDSRPIRPTRGRSRDGTNPIFEPAARPGGRVGRFQSLLATGFAASAVLIHSES